jgi:hypothetical protein
MIDTDKLSAMEAAARALAVENGLDPDDPTYQIGAMNPDRPVWMDHLSDARAAILAYLETLAGDEGTVRAVEDILRDPYGGINMQARAVLSTLVQRAKGD